MQFQLCLLCTLAFGANANQMEVTPVQKVVTLLQGMLEKGKAEKHSEQVAFAASKQFCEDTSAEKTGSIRTEGQRIGTLGAQIQKDRSDAKRYGTEISALQKDENIWSGNVKAATSVRAIEKETYDQTHKDYSESIDAIARAITVMKKPAGDRPQASSLVQLSSLQYMSLIPEHAKKAIDNFLGAHSGVGAELVFLQTDDEDNAAPEANGYEFQSNGVVDMLKKLQSKFIDERTTLEKEEANAKNSFEMLRQDLTSQVGQAEKDESKKSVFKGKTLQTKAMETSDRDDQSKLKNTDVKFLKDLTADCSMSAADFESRQQLRSEEIVAVEKAIEIISGDSVAGNAGKHLPSFLQKKGAATAAALPQLRSILNLNLQVQSRVAVLLHARAKTLNSLVLESVAKRVSADPMAKVKKMIKDLVMRLMEEANEESDHKGWCDTELGTNDQTRKEKTAAVETLHADIEGLTASIAKISEDVTSLTEAAAGLSTAMSTATKLRGEEKAEATTTVADAQDAQTAVAQALTVLKEFYAKASEATSFVQTLAPYTGMGSENGGVVGMLEVIESDFARLESEVKASEATAQKNYDTFMTDSKVDKASKDAAIEHKKDKNQDAQQTLTEKQNDLEGTQKELDAALTYYDKLKPSCVDSGVSYEDRVARRKEEVESLKEALQIMNGEDIAL